MTQSKHANGVSRAAKQLYASGRVKFYPWHPPEKTLDKVAQIIDLETNHTELLEAAKSAFNLDAVRDDRTLSADDCQALEILSQAIDRAEGERND